MSDISRLQLHAGITLEDITHELQRVERGKFGARAGNSGLDESDLVMIYSLKLGSSIAMSLWRRVVLPHILKVFGSKVENIPLAKTQKARTKATNTKRITKAASSQNTQKRRTVKPKAVVAERPSKTTAGKKKTTGRKPR